MKKWDTIIGGVVLGAIAVFLCWKATNIYHDISKTKGWIAHEGTLLSSRLDIKDKTDDNPDTYKVMVSYQYQVDGKYYTSNRLSFGYMHSNLDRHIELADKLKYARKVTVWVDPQEPAESSLIKGWSETALFFMMFTFIWTCGLGGFMFWELDTRGSSLKMWAKLLYTLSGIMFVLFFCRLGMAKWNDKYVIKLEDKVEVLEYMLNEEIKREKLLERARNEAFRKAETGQDTVRIRLEGDTFYVK